MTTSHWAGPLVVFGSTTSTPTPDYNPDVGTSLFWGGGGTLDQRKTDYWTYRPGLTAYRGWLGETNIQTVNFVPQTLATAAIAALQTATTAVALSLVTANARGVQVGAAITNATTGQTVTGLLLLDALTASFVGSITSNILTVASVNNGGLTVGSVLSGSSGANIVGTNTTIIGMAGMLNTTGKGTTGTYVINPAQSTVSSQITITAVAGINGIPLIPGNPFALAAPVTGGPYTNVQGASIYNPICMGSRAVQITTQSGDTAVYTVAGYDVYGFPMTEAITANGAASVNGKKAFKYIASVTPVGTVGAFAAVGTTDILGFPLASLSFQDVQINTNATVITSSTGYTAMDLTNPATTTTGDIRGTYSLQSASDGTKRTIFWQSPPPTNIIDSNGLFGVTQT